MIPEDHYKPLIMQNCVLKHRLMCNRRFQSPNSPLQHRPKIQSWKLHCAPNSQPTITDNTDLDGTILFSFSTSPPASPPPPHTHEPEEELLSEEYSDEMQKRMGNTSLVYRHEDGMNYTRILDDLIVGSCLQIAADVDYLTANENVRTILSLQEDCDMDYFALDLNPIINRCNSKGNSVDHIRHRIRDFDPISLRIELPGAVAAFAQSASKQGGTAYVHCTAGMGRAPAVALAYMWWVKGIHLEEGHALLTGKRTCSPRLASIRAATADLLYGGPPTPVEIEVFKFGTASQIEIAGLDVGWGCKVQLQRDIPRARFFLHRQLLPGTYQYKFIVDGHWTYSCDHPILNDGGNLNNYVTVEFENEDRQVMEGRERLLSEGGRLTEEEGEKLRKLIYNSIKSEGGVGMHM